MKAKKITALLLAATMVVSMTACGGNSASTTTDSTGTDAVETTESTAGEATDAADAAEASDDYEELLAEIIPEETVTLDVYSQLSNYSGEQIGWFGQVMLDKFNVKLNIIPDADGVYAYRPISPIFAT